MPDRAVRLTVPLGTGSATDVIELELAHLERFFCTAACVAIREGLLGTTERALGRLVPGRIRERHGDVLCLDSFAVELIDGGGGVRGRVEFSRRAFEVFAVARALHRLAGASATETPRVAYALHAIAVDDEPFPVALPHLPVCGLDHLTAAATVDGQPDDEWIATLVAPAVARGLGALAESSRATGIEAAGRIVARVGFDPTRRRFVRVLERLIVSRATHASATRVVSTAASWGDYLTEVPREGPQAIASVHTHVHLKYDGSGADGAPGDHLLVGGGGLSAAGDPCISLDDMLAHYRAFPDPLSAAVIVSVFPGRHEVRLYGYTPGAELRLEPGYWSLDGRELEV